MFKENRAQTSLEYLLLLGSIIAIATAVGLYLKSIPRNLELAIENQLNQPPR